MKTEKACWLKGEGYSAKSNPDAISGGLNATLAAQKRAAMNSTDTDDAWEPDTDLGDAESQEEEEGLEYPDSLLENPDAYEPQSDEDYMSAVTSTSPRITLVPTPLPRPRPRSNRYKPHLR